MPAVRLGVAGETKQQNEEATTSIRGMLSFISIYL